ncbi:hypothetical protein LSH36_37g10042 [Paralvinella palmiformis]|uniref:Uncharacterized protein n=1 Tax=Paralvinella palmiformis TaxID=53620 RepID=A0AAD9NFF6_9ANNE|nr:hypothetical protein LSH36_37g10042 [Paralvinella palmiformis]
MSKGCFILHITLYSLQGLLDPPLAYQKCTEVAAKQQIFYKLATISKVTRLQSHAEHLERVKIDDRAMVGLIDSELLVTTISYCAASTENVIDSRAMDTT